LCQAPTQAAFVVFKRNAAAGKPSFDEPSRFVSKIRELDLDGLGCHVF
jgi:hypothetical protein